MGFELTVDEVDLAEVGGKEKVLPGDYHLMVESVNEDGGDKGEMIVEFQILRGIVPNQEGRMWQHYFRKDLTKWPLRELTAFALAARLVTKEQLTKAKETGKSPVIEWTAAVGRTVCAGLKDNEYNGRHSTRLDFDNFWSPIDKRAAHIPLHANAMKNDGLVLPAGRPIDGILAVKAQAAAATGNGAKAGATTKSTTGAASAAATPSVDDALAGVV